MSVNSEVPPNVRTISDILEIEAIPLGERGLPTSTYELIRHSADAYPQNLAIRYIEDGDRWKAAQQEKPNRLSVDVSYAELLSNVHRTANLFRSLGVIENDSVSMVLPNVPEAHYTLWGGEACGVVNPINYLLEAGEIGEIVQAVGSKVLVIYGEHPDVDTWQKLPNILDKAPCVQHVLVVGQYLGASANNYIDFNEALQTQSPDGLMFVRDWSSEQVASLFHTGGTTGLPKLAQHTHGNEVYLSWALNRISNGLDNACYLTGLPLFHCNAAIGTGLSVFMAGGTVLLAGINGFRTPGIVANLYELIEQYQVTHFSAVPTIYSALTQVPVSQFDLSSIEFAACGAAPLSMELFKTFQQHTGIRLVEGYGLTEATVCSSMTLPGNKKQKIGSIGVRLPYTRMKAAVLGDNDTYIRDCEIEEVGSLLIAGPSITPGYTDATRNKGLFVTDNEGNRWLNSGDLARQDDDGHFWLTGRTKELIIRGGHNIDPKTIEEALSSHPAVNMAAAVGRPDRYVGELPIAYVETNRSVSAQELIRHCSENIGERAAIPKKVVIVDKLPVTGVGKIHKPTLCLMELESLVAQELQKLEIDLCELNVEANAHRKFGNTATITATLGGESSCAETETKIRSLLEEYTFHIEVSVR